MAGMTKQLRITTIAVAALFTGLVAGLACGPVNLATQGQTITVSRSMPSDFVDGDTQMPVGRAAVIQRAQEILNKN
jgi:hypothetical protein